MSGIFLSMMLPAMAMHGMPYGGMGIPGMSYPNMGAGMGAGGAAPDPYAAFMHLQMMNRMHGGYQMHRMAPGDPSMHNPAAAMHNLVAAMHNPAAAMHNVHNPGAGGPSTHNLGAGDGMYGGASMHHPGPGPSTGNGT